MKKTGIRLQYYQNEIQVKSKYFIDKVTIRAFVATSIRAYNQSNVPEIKLMMLLLEKSLQIVLPAASCAIVSVCTSPRAKLLRIIFAQL